MIILTARAEQQAWDLMQERQTKAVRVRVFFGDAYEWFHFCAIDGRVRVRVDPNFYTNALPDLVLDYRDHDWELILTHNFTRA